jgi:ATP-dependent RNA helicase RhlE
MAVPLTAPVAGFDQLGLAPSLLRGVVAAGFVEPRPIQVATLPAALAGRDVLGLAQTGTGKTAAFALPILQRCAAERRRGPRALILAPTRELATQIAEEIRMLACFTQAEVVCIFGGVSAQTQTRALARHPDIVVGCPGRVLDLIQQRDLRLGAVEMLVLDEADHMFDMGFLPDVRRILAELPRERQNMLFSATMPTEIRSLADRILRHPHVSELGCTEPPRTIDHMVVSVREDHKRSLLEHILAKDHCESAIVFTRTKRRARTLAQQLERSGVRVAAMQGNMSQPARTRAMDGFRNGSLDVLIATDILARGIDVQGISHVINFDVPNTPDAYTHRIGRTGRAECEGQAVTFVTRDDTAWLRATERKLGAPIARRVFEGFEAAEAESLDARTPDRGPQRAPARGARTPAREPQRGPARSTRTPARTGGASGSRGSGSGGSRRGDRGRRG